VITLSLPKLEGSVYAELFGVLAGPVGTAGYVTEEIPAYLDTDNLLQGPGLYGEKAVSHGKGEGHVSFVPHANAMKPAVMSGYPLYKTVNVSYASWPTVNTTLSLLYGDLAGGGYGYSVTSGNYYHKAATGNAGSFRVYSVTVPSSDPYRCTANYVEVKNVRRVGGNIAYEYRSVSMVIPTVDGSYWGKNLKSFGLQPQSIGWMMEIFDRSTPYSLDPFNSSTTMAYILRNTPIVSPSKMRYDISSFIANEMSWAGDPTKMIDYGDLAMRATSSVNANDVNMFAFLRDLRDIRSLIPKLKNLRKLKTHADNYLAIEYGVLPTIDDIKSIVRALKGKKAYLDRNGFRVVTAAHLDSGTKGLVTFDLVQRIKVAVNNEDMGLLSIMNKIDSMGFLLTFENVWDLIPYSFVIDWFLDIGDFLERIDSNLRIIRLGVRYSTLSYKVTASASLTPTSSFPYSGTVSMVRYHRWTIGHCPEPALFSNASTEPFTHWVEATALLIQRGRK